jgi:prepilin-type processing-associated H-X9-DG protein
LRYYEVSRKVFPPAYTVDASGRPLHSWRTLLLPYLEETSRYSQIRLGEPWNSPHNLPLTQVHFDWLHCAQDKSAGDFDTSYVAIVGSGTIWDPARVHNVKSVRDGLSNTILLVEMQNSGIKWAEPRDLDLSNLPLGITKQNLPKWLSAHSGGFHAVFADGSVRLISSQIPWQIFMALLTEDGGEQIPPGQW